MVVVVVVVVAAVVVGAAVVVTSSRLAETSAGALNHGTCSKNEYREIWPCLPELGSLPKQKGTVLF